jgi:biotin operon repressor
MSRIVEIKRSTWRTWKTISEVKRELGVSYDCVRRAMDRLREDGVTFEEKVLVGAPGVRPVAYRVRP